MMLTNKCYYVQNSSTRCYKLSQNFFKMKWRALNEITVQQFFLNDSLKPIVYLKKKGGGAKVC